MAGEPYLPDRVREKAGVALSINGDGARDDGNGREDDGDLGVGVEAVVEGGGWCGSGGGRGVERRGGERGAEGGKRGCECAVRVRLEARGREGGGGRAGVKMRQGVWVGPW